MKISIDHVTNSSGASFGTLIGYAVLAIFLGIPFISATLGNKSEKSDNDSEDKNISGGGSSGEFDSYPSTDPEEDEPGNNDSNESRWNDDKNST